MYKKCAQLVETTWQNLVYKLAQFPHKAANKPKATEFSHIYTGKTTQVEHSFRTLYTAKIDKITDQIGGLYTLCTQPITTTTTYINKKEDRKERV